MTELAGTSEGRRRADLTRRQFVQAAAGACLLGGVGYGLSRVLGQSGSPPQAVQFRSRPDLNPPPTEVLVPARRTAPGLVMLTAARTTDYQHGPMIVDNAGRLVWFAPRTHGSINLQVQSYEGRPVLTWWEGRIVKDGGFGRGEYVIAGPDYQEITRVRAGNGLMGDLHEFFITSRDTALFTAYRIVDRDLSPVGGPVDGRLIDGLVQEVDIKTGRVLFQWSAADHVALDESYIVPPGVGGEAFDFFHINSIDVTGDGNLLVSARNTFALYKVDRTSGAVIWRLGGKRTDFKMGPRAKFAFQHDARHHPDGVLTLFDDGAGPPDVQPASRGLKLAVDERAMRVHLLREYVLNPPVLATSQGSVQLLPNGDALVGWGIQPYFSEHGRDADLRFEAKLGSTSNSYRARRSVWVGTPVEPPAIAVQRLGGGLLDVYASWNGGTELRRWEVLAGGSADQLRRVGAFARDGFETAMRVTTSSRYVAVQALDEGGKILGRSASVMVLRD